MKLKRFTWKNGRLIRENTALTCADTTNDLPAIDSFAGLLPNAQNFFCVR